MAILIESENLKLTSGTGIATYAGALSQSLRQSGHSTMAVVGTATRITTKDELLGAAQLHDARHSLKRPLAEALRRARYWTLGDPLGATAQRLPVAGQSHMGASPLLREGGFDSIYGVPHLGLRAEMHFKRYGRLLRLKGITGARALHATQPIALAMKGVPHICTIHDIIPLRLPNTTLANKREHYQLLSLLLRSADKIITVSEYSRKDIISAFKVPEDRIVNTYQSTSLPAHILSLNENELADRLEASFGLGYRKYFLFVGAIEPKKNIRRLIDGYAASGSHRPLVLAGGLGWLYEEDVRAMADDRFQRFRITDGLVRPERRVQHLNYVSRADLAVLLRGARALVFPSLYEGFGLPVLEAMIAGTPVITSHVSSLPEVAGEAAEYVDPYNVDTIAAAIRRLDCDDLRCSELVEKGRAQAKLFSPEHYSERLAALYTSIL